MNSRLSRTVPVFLVAAFACDTAARAPLPQPPPAVRAQAPPANNPSAAEHDAEPEPRREVTPEHATSERSTPKPTPTKPKPEQTKDESDKKPGA